MDALLAAEVDDLLLAERGVVLDLVDGRGDGYVGEELLEVALGVLRSSSLGEYIAGGRWRRGGKGEKGPLLTLETPMALALPVARSFSIDFHVSMCECECKISLLPSASVGKRSWLPLGFMATGQCYRSMLAPFPLVSCHIHSRDIVPRQGSRLTTSIRST